MIDASLKPMMAAYMESLEARLRAAGFAGRVLAVTSQGGVLDGRWSLFDYTPVTATASALEIIEKLSPIPEAACTQCPEFGEFTRPERLNQKRPVAQ